MYHEDLSPYCHKLPFNLDGVLCVGWLDREHAFPTGPTSDEFVERLRWIITHRTLGFFDVHAGVIRCITPCRICCKMIDCIAMDGKSHPLGMSEIWIPCGDRWLAAPSMVVHYIDTHSYKPPGIFITAVMALDISQPYIAEEIWMTCCRNRSKDATS